MKKIKFLQKKKVISIGNFPGRLPLASNVLCWLALDHWNAPQWLYGAFGLLYFFMWGHSIIRLFTEEKVDIFEDDNKSN